MYEQIMPWLTFAESRSLLMGLSRTVRCGRPGPGHTKPVYASSPGGGAFPSNSGLSKEAVPASGLAKSTGSSAAETEDTAVKMLQHKTKPRNRIISSIKTELGRRKKKI